MRNIAPVQTLHKDWRLIHDPDDTGRECHWELGLPQEGSVAAEVPSFVHLYLPDCEGIAWYERTFRTAFTPDADHIVSLRFEMADFLCEVYVNGHRVGTHRGTENPFSFDISKELKPVGEENLLSVRISKPGMKPVDGYTFWEIPHRNQFPDHLKPGCCYNEYGLSGAVTVSLLPRLRMTDLYLNGNVATRAVDVECTVVNDYDHAVQAQLSLLTGDKRTGNAEAEDEYAFTAPCGETVIKRSIPVPEMRLWDIDDPNLYFVNAELSSENTTHVQIKHCGFRTFEVRNNGFFYLNGRRVFLRGSHTGNCMPESTHHLSRDKALLRKDFVMAKAAGLNMVRFISGTALPEQLDYCDELGLMVYEEPVSSWLLQDGPHARELYQYDLLTMIKRDRSHASITIWGTLNETQSMPPWRDACFIARESLEPLRELDETRMVLYSSGRFDGDPWIGSVANPYSHRWNCLWDGESEYNTVNAPWAPPLPGPYHPEVGDKHIYPKLPHSKFDINLIRTMGGEHKRPVFLSEYGVGSLFDVLWLQRKFEENGADPRMPDVAMVNGMANAFMDDLRRYDMENEFASPHDIMVRSHELHNRSRLFGFDMIRSNPYCCGFSLTGLLDHSICGEGLWTLMREWKSGIADTLQDGLAPLRWCLFLDDMHVYAGRPFTIEAVLANEDILKVRSYPIRIRIEGKQGIVWEKCLDLDVKAEDLKLFSIPVLKEEISLDVPEGDYALRAEILEGAAAFGGKLHFHVSEDAKTCAEVGEIVGISLGESITDFLKGKGIKIIKASEAKKAHVVLVGEVEAEAREETWKQIGKLLEKGCRVIAADRWAFAKDDDLTYYMPLENKPSLGRGVAPHQSSDWLYHKEYLARRNHPYFKGLETGLMDWDYYLYLTCGVVFDAKEHVPDDVAAIGFNTGEISNTGYAGGVELGTYELKKGALTICALRMTDCIGVNPAADRLLMNMLNTESARLK